MTAWRQLRHLLRGRPYRQLLVVRVASQLADGVFQAALASFVLSPERAPTALALAGAFAVVLLPFSILGPFVGVFLDRWLRRQVLVYANLWRVPLVLALALGAARDIPSWGLLLLALASLSVDRFLLAGLSAALPQVVAREDLVVANSLTPTAGTASFLIGLSVGSTVRLTSGSDSVVFVAAAVLYVAAALTALRIPRRALGPDEQPHSSLRQAVAEVSHGLSEGLAHLRERRTAAYALGTIGAHRFFYGISTVAVILLYRGYFYGPTESDTAFAQLSIAVLVAGLGFVTAAFVTPQAASRTGPRGWIVVLLGAAALVQVVPTGFFTVPTMLASAFLLGLVSQGIKISVDTLVQTHVADAFRGRVFVLYDVVFNLAFVAAAFVAALILPADGKSLGVLVVMAVGYALTAAVYARTLSR